MLPSSRIHPLGDCLVVQRRAEQEEIRGGVIVPESAREKPQEAIVIALGSGQRLSDGTIGGFNVKVGDTVLVGHYGGTEVRIADQKYTIVREDDILGLLT